MGNKSWGKGYHTGYGDGLIKGRNGINPKTLLIALPISIICAAIPIVSDYIFTRKLKQKSK
jgi:hypothetical protein